MKISHRVYRCLLLFAALSIIPALLPVSADDSGGTFVVKNGAFPWTDRVNVWQLADVPSSLDGNGPLPQQSCGSRLIAVPDGAKSIIFAVSNKDLDKFKLAFPDAKPTGDTVSVAHPDGTGAIPYTVFKWQNPPSNVGDKTLVAGLILLQINDKPEASASSAPGTAK